MMRVWREFAQHIHQDTACSKDAVRQEKSALEVFELLIRIYLGVWAICCIKVVPQLRFTKAKAAPPGR